LGADQAHAVCSATTIHDKATGEGVVAGEDQGAAGAVLYNRDRAAAGGVSDGGVDHDAAVRAAGGEVKITATAGGGHRTGAGGTDAQIHRGTIEDAVGFEVVPGGKRDAAGERTRSAQAGDCSAT